MDKLIGALFDWSMRKPATPHLVRILYVLSVVLAGAQCVLLILGGFSKGIVAGIIALLLSPLAFFLTVAVVRLGLEAIMALHRTASYTGELARAQRPKMGEASFDAGAAAGGGSHTRVSNMGRSGF